jgi:uncharacterized protein YdaL
MATTLVLYDTTGQWGWLGELYGIMVANLASHFGSWTALPVVSYTAGQMSKFSAVVYMGSTYGEPIPAAFLNDVVTYQTIPVIWAYDNIWQLVSYFPNFTTTYGWMWSGFDNSSVAQVNYKGQQLSRYAANGAGIMNYSTVGSGVTVLANAVRSDGSMFPWALRSRNLTYIGENPLVYIAEGDRYLAFCDLLFDALAPITATRHRALVRLEDIDPTYDPNTLRNVADYLYSMGVPFGFQITPLYLDPLGYYNNGVPQTVHLKDSPGLVKALKYLQSRGGVMIEHGYTHQYSNIKNPYTGVTGDDCEFFRLTMNADYSLNYLGPVPEDSTTWATNRITSAAAELAAVGFKAPNFFTFPSYLASATDINVIKQNFAARAERSLYYVGLLSGSIDSTRYVGQYFPYVVKDVYPTKVLPDNLGGISPQPFFAYPPRLPSQIVADAQRSLVVRDGFASFFYNTDDDISYLQTTIQGIQKLGYTFVSPSSL